MATPSTSDGTHDVIVVGGGLAGAATAMFLALNDHRCLVLESAKSPRYHVGESLNPHTYGTLDRMGLLPKLLAAEFPDKYSVQFVSRMGKGSTPFYFSERIPSDGAGTWQVQRSEFDDMILNHAHDHGVEVQEGTHVDEVLFADGRTVSVRAGRGHRTV